jgi:hypothetical protein
MGLEHLAQPVGQDLELLGPGQGGIEVDVDLGQDAVKEQVLELLFVADVVVERAGDYAQARGQAAHGEGLDALLGDDREDLGDHLLAGELGAAVLVVGWAGQTTARMPPAGLRAGRTLPLPHCWMRPVATAPFVPFP